MSEVLISVAAIVVSIRPLVLGIYLIRRAQRNDLPRIAESIFGRWIR